MYPPSLPVSSRTRSAIDRRCKENHQRPRSTSSMFPEESSPKGFFKKSRAYKNHLRSPRSDSRPPENFINLVDDDLPPRRGKKQVASQNENYWRGKEKIVIDDAQRRVKKLVAPSEDNWKGKEKVVVDDSEDDSDDEEEDDEIYVTGATTSGADHGCHIQSPIDVSSSDVECEDSEFTTGYGLTSSSDSAEETGSDPEYRPNGTEDEVQKELSVDEVVTTSSSGESRSLSHDSGSSRSRSKKVGSLSVSSRSRKTVSPKRKRKRQEVMRKQKSPEVACSTSSTGNRRQRRTTSAEIGRKVQKYRDDVSSDKEVERGATPVHEGSVSSSSRGTRKRKTSAQDIGNTVQYSTEQTIPGKEVAHEGSVSCSCQTPSKEKKTSAQESISVKEVEKEQQQHTHEISVSTSVQSKSNNAGGEEKESVHEKAKKAAKTTPKGTTTTTPGNSHFVAHRTRSHEPNKNENLKNLGFVSRPITLDEEDRINSFQDQQRSNGVDLQKYHRESRIKRKTTLADDAQEKGENVGLDVRERIRLRDKKEKEAIDASVDDDHENENSEIERLKKLAKKKLSEAAMKLSLEEINELLAHFMTLNEENDFLEELYEEEKRNLSRLYGGGLYEDKVVPERPVDEFHDLWMEMEMCLAAEEIGCSDSCVLDGLQIDEDALSSSPESVDQRQLCEKGKHQLVLEEQIGLVCRFCNFIETEIQHVTAPFHTDPLGVSSSRRHRYRYPPTRQDPVSPNQQPGNLFLDPCSTDEDDVYIPTGKVWDLIPGLKKGMYEHQIEGFEFMWKNISGKGTIQLSKLPKKHSKLDCGGCIISHAPGTGKTRLAISFLQSYVKLYKDSRPVIIAPCSMLLTWAKEFKTWKVDVPFHNLNDHLPSREEFKPYLWLLGKCRNQKAGMSNTVRLVKLQSWLKGGSVLGISYKLFEQLVGDDSYDESRRKKTPAANFVEQKMREALVKHSGLLVLDEGHTPRNEASKIFQALCKVETNKRIILSGTPFQNNLVELYNTLCLVQPDFPETLPEEDRGIFTQQTKRGRRDEDKAPSAIPKEKLRLLRARIKRFVHIHKGAILLEKLPGLSEYVLVLKPSDWQKELFSKAEHIHCFLESDYLLSLLSVHPSLICADEKPEAAAEAHNSAISDESNRRKFFNGLPLQDRKRLKHHKSEPWVGLKANFVIELVRLCSKINERVLVFSRLIEPLEFLSGALCSMFNWEEGVQIHYMHGKMRNKKRQHVMDEFNDPCSEAKVLLASTKACSEGIKLVGASRVVLLDVVWNPSVERQAISRAYRIGQKRRVYVYHLIASGTNEEDKYSRQIQKDEVSESLFWKGKEEGEGKQKLEGKVSTAVTTDDSVLDMMVRNDKVIFEKMFSKRSLGVKSPAYISRDISMN